MSAAALLAEARTAGLRLEPDGDRLVIEGPRDADALARRIIAAKPAVMAALTSREPNRARSHLPHDNAAPPTPAALLVELRRRRIRVWLDTDPDGVRVLYLGERAHDAAFERTIDYRRHDLIALLDPGPDTGADPRPDLTDDTAQWMRLLALAHERHDTGAHGVYGVLLGMRSMGVELTTGVGTLRLQPRTADPGRAPRWATPAEYREWRPIWLDPHREELIRLLADAAPHEIAQP